MWEKKFALQIMRREVLAGITTFASIAYILIVNPMILAEAGIPVKLSVFATIFVSFTGCMLMAFWADAPIVLTPGMGVNAFFTYTLVAAMGMSWQEALAVSFFAGIFFMLAACTRCSKILSAAVPASLKYAITAGMGLLLVEIGLEKAGLICRGESSILMPGSLQAPSAMIALLGLLLSLGFYLRNIRGGFLFAILITAALGNFYDLRGSIPDSVGMQDLFNYTYIFCKMDFSYLIDFKFWMAVFSLAMILILESMGVLEAMLPDKHKFKKTFSCTAVTSFLSSVMGTSPAVPVSESLAGIASGGRTGIMPGVCGVLFLLALCFVPGIAYIPEAAIAPVIIITGAMMMQQMQYLEFNDFSEWFPAFLIIVMMPLTGSISTGLAFGFAAYPILKFLAGKGSEVHSLGTSMGVLFLLELVFQSNF